VEVRNRPVWSPAPPRAGPCSLLSSYLGALFFAGILFTTPAWALTGEQLFQQCSAADSADRKQCESYIAGVVDGINTLTASMKLLHPSGPEYPKLFCVAPSEPINRLVDAVTGYLSRNPSDRHFGAASEVLLALQEAFPCIGS
jgi:hypothetical protein